MKPKINSIKLKLNKLPSRTLPLQFFFFSTKKRNCSCPNAATWPRAAKQTQSVLQHPFRDSNMADAAWRKLKDKWPVYTTDKIGTARIKRRTAPTKFDV